LIAYETSPNSIPNPAPIRRAAITNAILVVGEKMTSSSPRKIPSHAPDAAPAAATRPQVSLPVTRSTLLRSLPTIES
jgi:hypothetical protein